MAKTIDGKIYYSYEDIHSLVESKSEEIKDLGIDTVVAIATGGWFPGRILRTYLQTENHPVQLYSVGVQNYDTSDNCIGEPILDQSLPPEVNLIDKQVLVVDEVADSGLTLEFVMNHYMARFNLGKTGNIYSFVLHEKARSIYNANFTGEKMNDEWIVYPWDQTIPYKNI